MRRLHIDLETWSSVNLKDAGIFPYFEDPGFEILLMAYAFDDEPVKVIDCTKRGIPRKVYEALTDPDVAKWAWNAAFERNGLEKWLGVELPVEQWNDTMILSATAGFPLGLDAAGRALRMGVLKDSRGSKLIQYFCVPCTPTKTNGGRERNLPKHNESAWAEFIEYNRKDVEVERSIYHKLTSMISITDYERRLWHLDQTINERGIRVDPDFVRNAITTGRRIARELKAEGEQLSGVRNFNSVPQVLSWINNQIADSQKWMDTEFLSALKVRLDKLNKESVANALKGNALPPDVRRVLEIRKEAAKASIKKYDRILKMRCHDDRIRGMMQFGGAARTGRWAGRGVQFQNLVRSKMPDLHEAREVILSGETSAIRLMWDSPLDVLAQLIRTAFIPSPGNRFIVSDFSAIEARVLAWLADETWRLDVFETHGKIYEASAAQMFGLPIESITGELRQKGKVSELALGYGGGPRALIAMGALEMGLTEDELPAIVSAWRQASPGITKFWRTMERLALAAMSGGGATFKGPRGIWMKRGKGGLLIRLPSGRALHYPNARVATNKFGSEAIIYDGQGKNGGSWVQISTYGGKLTENITQAVARDCLAEAIIRLEKANYPVVTHVHDETVSDVPEGYGSCHDVERIMAEPMPWAPGLPLKAEAFESYYYKK